MPKKKKTPKKKKAAYVRYLEDVGKTHEKALSDAAAGKVRALSNGVEKLSDMAKGSWEAGDTSLGLAISRDVDVLRVKLNKLRRKMQSKSFFARARIAARGRR